MSVQKGKFQQSHGIRHPCQPQQFSFGKIYGNRVHPLPTLAAQGYLSSRAASAQPSWETALGLSTPGLGCEGVPCSQPLPHSTQTSFLQGRGDWEQWWLMAPKENSCKGSKCPHTALPLISFRFISSSSSNHSGKLR